MWKRLGWEHLINAEVTASVVLISSWHFPRQVWWQWHLRPEENWLPVVPCVFAMGKSLLITSVGSLGSGSYLGPLWNLFLGVVFYSSGFFTHIHIFGLDPSIKIWSTGPLVLNPSSSSSPYMHNFNLMCWKSGKNKMTSRLLF